MKTKLLNVFVLGMLSISGVNAQWSITPEIGMTSVNRADNRLDDVEWLSSWRFGAGVDYDFHNSNWGISSGLYFTQRKWNTGMLTMNENKQPSYTSYNLKANSFYLPVMPKIGISLKPDVQLTFAAGPYIGYCFSYNSDNIITNLLEAEHGYSTYYTDSHKNESYFDWGIMAKTELEIKKWVFNVGYELSLPKEYDSQEIGARYHTLSLSLGYRFQLGK